MGLLEKAGKIQTDDKPPAGNVVLEAVVDPVPVIPVKKSRKSKKIKSPKKAKTPRTKRVKLSKSKPDGFEPATRGQKLTRRVVDFTVSYGWSIPILALTGWGSYFNPTPFFIMGMVLIIANLGVLPSQTGRSIGNWVSRTRYVNTRGEPPIWIYIFMKGLTTVFILLGLIAILSLPVQGLGDTIVTKIFTIFGIVMIIPPIIDYSMYRFRKDSELGLWDTLFGGVWIVRTNKSAEAKGWLKRLESLGDFAESRGLLKDKEDLS